MQVLYPCLTKYTQWDFISFYLSLLHVSTSKIYTIRLCYFLLAIIRHLTGWCISQHSSKIDIVDISYACVLVRICLECVFVHVRMCVCVCVRVYAFIFHEMCMSSSKKANLYEIVYLFKNAFFTFHRIFSNNI